MKRTILFGALGLFFIVTGLRAQQDCNCSNSLAFLHEKITRYPAYKKNKAAYQEAFQLAKEAANTAQTDYACYQVLNRLIVSLNDNHSRVHGVSPSDPDYSGPPADQIGLPRTGRNLDSLRTALADKPVEAIEGIYSKEGLELGVYRQGDTSYQGVILQTTAKNWVPGEIMLSFIPIANGYYLAYGGQFSNKRLISYTERFKEDGRMLLLGLQKDSNLPNYSRTPYPDTTFLRKELAPDITYIKVGSFSSYYPALSEAEDFYKTLEGTLTKPHLIVDLRGNSGGGWRNSDILFKILKKYLKQNRVYVLTSHNTVSNGEIFTWELSRYDNCITLGDRTQGTLSYEIKNSTFALPCGRFLAVLTSRSLDKYREAESVGIAPARVLDYNKPWIDQTVQFIREQQ